MNSRTCEKAELHCHLGGLLCPEYLRLAQRTGHCPDLSVDTVAAMYPVTDVESWNAVMEYMEPFETKNPALFHHVLGSHLDSLIVQNVKYVEIMMESFLMIDFDELVAWMERFRQLPDGRDIEVGYLWAIGRSPDKDLVASKAERIAKLHALGLLDGFAMAADESACTIRDHADTFGMLANEGVPVEIHAGEWLGPESVWDALEFGQPSRIGHGIRAFEDLVLVRHLVDHDVHLEFCPTSNLKLAGVDAIEKHPIFRALDQGMNFSINTDDPGHLECSMVSEFELVASVVEFDVGAVYRNSLRSAFRDVAKREGT